MGIIVNNMHDQEAQTALELRGDMQCRETEAQCEKRGWETPASDRTHFGLLLLPLPCHGRACKATDKAGVINAAKARINSRAAVSATGRWGSFKKLSGATGGGRKGKTLIGESPHIIFREDTV
ncbi:hypothetical protein CIHG_07278 [Coccidioides immitis H538.4]|uniref:Uncharacterized protein n=2 Tax=Coccidioides immitis TaxID=5501 RepID=A0A0J8RY17_COCIT|nr:hypothetical protein CIRG_09183 [Coccidioides immitis RMSCC 2394]KMU89471.1 hypothetical protein CIHG_07278 [Coccidioides immitis H538.4]